MSRRTAALGLSAWTLFVWTFRIGTIWDDGGASTASKVGRTALALSFTVLAVLTIAGAVRRRISLPVLRAFAGWTVAVWVVRGVGIATGDHGAAFVIVHLVLGVVSIALATLAVRARDAEPALARN